MSAQNPLLTKLGLPDAAATAAAASTAPAACRLPPALGVLLSPLNPWHFASLAGGYSAARLFSTDADSHDDFKPQVKAAPAGDVEATIEKDISSHDVFIYMKVRWSSWQADSGAA